MTQPNTMQDTLNRIADALERMAPKSYDHVTIGECNRYVWNPDLSELTPIKSSQVIPLNLMVNRDLQKDLLLKNTRALANNLPANNALLWGARGTGKSFLVKSVHHYVNTCTSNPIVLIEINREDLHTLPPLLSIIKRSNRPVILFCDDLSFDYTDSAYKNLKTALDGGIAGTPQNMVMYATSNQRHMVSRQMMENARKHAIHETEVIEEKVSLSDRFGLWIGFHALDQNDYLTIIANYIKAYKIPVDESIWHPLAIEWTITRGARSGRVAWQFILDLASQYGIKIDNNSS